MSKLSFTHLVELEGNDAIVLAEGMNAEGKPVSAYMRMDKKNLEAFSRAIQSGRHINFGEFGEIILACEGSPDAEARLWMEEEYGFKHN